MTDDRTQRTDVPEYHTVGIGAGPANLSLAALFESSTSEQIALFESQPGPAWHNTPAASRRPDADLVAEGPRLAGRTRGTS